jgi:outer membrane protein assembly factor BamB
MRLKPIFLLFALSLNAFGQSISDINASNPQRTRVLSTQGLKAPPQEVFWKTERLFELRNSNWLTSQSGPLRISVDLPTPEGFSVPIVAGDYLYFSFGDFNSYMFAVDKVTGKKATVLRLDNTAVSPPAAGRNMVFFGTSAGRLLAYDPTLRELKWKSDRSNSFAGSPPLVDGELVYSYDIGKGMYAFVADTGVVKWLFKSSQFVHVPAVAGGRLFMTVEPDRLVAVERETGVVKWEVKVGRDASAPAIMDNRVFLLFKNGEIRSYSTTDGALQWKLNDTLRNGGSPLALYRGIVYFVGRNDSVIALDAATGEEKFRFATKRQCQAPVIASDLLYVTCLDNKLYALSPATLKAIWEMPNGNTIPPTPVFADGVMYWLGSDGYMFALR